MINIVLEESFINKIKTNINTNLTFDNIIVSEYTQKDNGEYLKITLSNQNSKIILLYYLNSKNQEISLIDKSIITKSLNQIDNPYIDLLTIKNIYDYCRILESKKNTTYDPKISKLFEIIAKGFPLNDELLKEYHYTEEDIQELLDNNMLIKINPNEYTISLINELYQYGIKLYSTNRKMSALSCFKKCYESVTDKRELCLKILLHLIKIKNYSDALNVYDKLSILSEENNQEDSYLYLYLYLLNMLTDCKEEHHQTLDEYDQDELLSRYRFQKDYEISKAIILNKFKYAFKLLNDLLDYSKNLATEDAVLRELVRETVNVEEHYKSNLYNYIYNEKYEQALSLLKEKFKHRYLNSKEIYIRSLIETLLNILNTKTVPEKVANTSKCYQKFALYDAIQRNDFLLAKKINRQFLDSKNKNPNTDLIDILLTKINDAILEIELSNIDNSTGIVKSSNNSELSKDTELSIKNEDNNNIELTNNGLFPNQSSSFEDSSEISFAKEMAYYIKDNNISLDTARTSMGIDKDTFLLIKLIYVRDYFLLGQDEVGKNLLNEVKSSNSSNYIVLSFIDEITKHREDYHQEFIKSSKRKTLIP